MEYSSDKPQVILINSQQIVNEKNCGFQFDSQPTLRNFRKP